jgi:hypothetical protein
MTGHFHGSSFDGSIGHEIVGPGVVAILRLQADQDPSLSDSRPRLGCRPGIFSPSRHQIRCTRLALTRSRPGAAVRFALIGAAGIRAGQSDDRRTQAA